MASEVLMPALSRRDRGQDCALGQDVRRAGPEGVLAEMRPTRLRWNQAVDEGCGAGAGDA
jgi:hypothetical protein